MGMIDEKPMTMGKISCVRDRSKIGNRSKYVHKMIIARGHKNILIREPVISHTPRTIVILQMRTIVREDSRTLNDV